MSSNPETITEVKKTINDFFDAYSAQDIDKAMECIETDDEATFIGSGLDEKRIGYHALRDGIQRDFSQAKSIGVSVPWMRVNAEGDAAWAVFDCILTVSVDGSTIQMNGRETAILRKQNGKWKIAHMHFSVPAINQAEGESFAPAA